MQIPMLTLYQARSLALAAQGLARSPVQPSKKPDLLDAIRRIHALQIDTIHVVARAPYHILWSRLGNYDPSWLDALHAEGKLFEYWAHAACFLPIEDYPIYRRIMLDDRVGWDNIKQWGGENQEVLDEVLHHIRQHGAAKSSDFKRPKNGNGWWNWKLEKVALEYLFTKGDLMIARRENFQRVYDLRERVLPAWDDTQALSYEEAIKMQVLRSVQALGIAREDWVAPYLYLPKKKVAQLLVELASRDELLRVSVEEMNGKDFFIHPTNLGLLKNIVDGQFLPDKTTLLSPFDPLINDRARAKALFNFDYAIECYLPVEKRRFGYFVLPILHHGSLIARLDAKAWRKEKRLEVIKIFLEEGVQITGELTAAIRHALQDYAAWQNLEYFNVSESDPPELAWELV